MNGSNLIFPESTKQYRNAAHHGKKGYKMKRNGRQAWQTHNEGVLSAHGDDCAVYRPQQRRHNVLNVLKHVSL